MNRTIRGSYDDVQISGSQQQRVLCIRQGYVGRESTHDLKACEVSRLARERSVSRKPVPFKRSTCCHITAPLNIPYGTEKPLPWYLLNQDPPSRFHRRQHVVQSSPLAVHVPRLSVALHLEDGEVAAPVSTSPAHASPERVEGTLCGGMMVKSSCR